MSLRSCPHSASQHSGSYVSCELQSSWHLGWRARAVNDAAAFAMFKRDPEYRVVLEHVEPWEALLSVGIDLFLNQLDVLMTS